MTVKSASTIADASVDRSPAAYIRLAIKMVVLIAVIGGGMWYVSDRYKFTVDPQENKSLYVSRFIVDTYQVPAAHELSYDEIIVFQLPPELWPKDVPWPERVLFTKRVAGLPNDRVVVGEYVTEVNDQGVAIGLDLSQKLQKQPADFHRSYVVPAEHFLPMGDSLDSYDGRYFGPIHERWIRGRVVLAW